MTMKLVMTAAACAMLAVPGAALAQQAVIANADLNVRTGPGDDYPVVDRIALDSELLLLGCMEASEWCQVSYGDREGWVSSDYLLAAAEEADIPVVIYEGPADGTMVGSISGDYEPTPQVRAYIEDNRYEPVYLEGEFGVGTSLPETVEVYEIPDYEYRYVYINDRPVLVEPQTRRIVYIVR
ncbi:MAG: DUF1236 domain-containing protein [Aquamicrobium sp.]|uniref:DUF1236 domain-containing protein n=1 Tax=Aquamicrobium sp. TaxID=1872579 RepID=UPI00349EF8A5|nr:DUF1236 domain-containing protein [Aquamicrobium sp.]